MFWLFISKCSLQLLGIFKLTLYLFQVLFTPATQAARQAACTIVEALTTIPSRKQQVLDLLTRYKPQTNIIFSSIIDEFELHQFDVLNTEG